MKKKKKVKIAFMVPGLGRIQRGAEVVVADLAKGLSDNYEVTIFSVKEINQLCQASWAIPQDGWFLKKVFRLFPWLDSVLDDYFAHWPTEVESLTFSFSVFFKLLKGNYDVFFPVSIWGVIMARVLRALKGTKFVYLNHGGAENFIAQQKPDAFVALTPDVLRWAKKKHPGLNSVLIPNGINLAVFSSKVKPVKLELEKPIFLCVAALAPSKRIDLTVKAVSKLKKGSLLVLGKGELGGALKKLGKKLLGEKRFLLTGVAHSEMPAYYAAADVFTLASRDDPFPTVYLEAMASGLPVVAPKEERREFTVGGAGILCDVENNDEYARALEKSVGKEWRSLPQQQVRKFSLKKQAERHQVLINQMIKV